MSCTTVKARPGSDGSSTSSFPNSERQLGPLREYLTRHLLHNSDTVRSARRPIMQPTKRRLAGFSKRQWFKGVNVQNGENDGAFAEIARHHQFKGVKWVILSDFYYVEGSSQEHPLCRRGYWEASQWLSGALPAFMK